MIRFVAAVFASVLPRRYWRRLDAVVPVARAALVSGIVSMLGAAAVAIPAYLQFTEASSRAAVQAMLRATGWRPPDGAAAPSVDAAMGGWIGTWFSPIAFLLFTPAGLLSAYFMVTGLFRAVSAYVDDARGDPVLTAIDALVRRSRTRARTRREREAREALEGPEVRDRLVTGSAAGFPEADFVVVASRRKPDWEPGAFIITAEKWYRLGEPAERQMPGGLRTFYPLTEITDHEVLRRGVPYELPPLSGPASKSG
ncbi:MAG: hypothetical protein FJW14_10160 [Acidimicrobiia bacterium]|nr:hypothetical protein [Acidimicrobiia bacterium]